MRIDKRLGLSDNMSLLLFACSVGPYLDAFLVIERLIPFMEFNICLAAMSLGPFNKKFFTG